MSTQQVMTEYLQAFIQGMKSSGVQQAVISPGSRSTPLALLLHRETAIETFVMVDERSAAFFALGLSKASQQPVALLCTSGTAAANYYPAICEANASHIPLIVLTTDRPHELRQVGAPQSMDQLQLFQNHVKLFVEMALPEATPEMVKYAYWQGMRSVATALQTPSAPVHLNFPLREPLLPDLSLAVEAQKTTEIISGKACLTKDQVSQVIQAWQGKKGILIIGGTHSIAEANGFIQLAEALNWPLISDPLANVITSGATSEVIISHTDLFIKEVARQSAPEVVVRFGPLPIAKSVMQWLNILDEQKTAFYFVDETGQWQDQLKQTQVAIQAEEQTFITASLAKISTPTEASWLNQWLAWEEIVQTSINECLDLQELNETSASLAVHHNMVADGQLFVSNSMAIRYLDRFMQSGQERYRLFGNRGINGIDGIVSTALGMSAIQPMSQNILLIGDLAMYHDMNGLLLAKRYQLPLTVVLLNNNGGGIFSFLSQRELRADDFEPLFGTPIDLDFSLVAELYGGEYTAITNLTELNQKLAETQSQPKFQIIEVKGSRTENVALYEKIVKTIQAKLASQDNQ